VPLLDVLKKEGRSFGTGGRSLLCAIVKKPRSRELEEFRDEDRVAI
jgi:hypothetical protein